MNETAERIGRRRPTNYWATSRFVLAFILSVAVGIFPYALFGEYAPLTAALLGFFGCLFLFPAIWFYLLDRNRIPRSGNIAKPILIAAIFLGLIGALANSLTTYIVTTSDGIRPSHAISSAMLSEKGNKKINEFHSRIVQNIKSMYPDYTAEQVAKRLDDVKSNSAGYDKKILEIINEEPFLIKYSIFMHGKWDDLVFSCLGGTLVWLLMLGLMFFATNRWILPYKERV